MQSAICFNLDQSKILSSGNGLRLFNSLPNKKILNQSKFKAFADNKITDSKTEICVGGKKENIVGKGENAGYQHFLFFPKSFQKFSFPEVLKVGIVW